MGASVNSDSEPICLKQEKGFNPLYVNLRKDFLISLLYTVRRSNATVLYNLRKFNIFRNSLNDGKEKMN